MSTTSMTREATALGATSTDPGGSVIVRAGALADALHAVTLISKSKAWGMPPLLRSAWAEIGDGGLRLMATDKYRLLEATMRGTAEGDAIGVIPHELLAQTVKALGKARGADGDRLVTVTMDERSVTIATESQRIGGDLVQGTYPDVQGLLDPGGAEAVEEVAFNAGFLGDLTKMARGKTDPVRMTFHGRSRIMHAQWSTAREDSAVTDFHYVLHPVRRAG